MSWQAFLATVSVVIPLNVLFAAGSGPEQRHTAACASKGSADCEAAVAPAMEADASDQWAPGLGPMHCSGSKQ